MSLSTHLSEFLVEGPMCLCKNATSPSNITTSGIDSKWFDSSSASDDSFIFGLRSLAEDDDEYISLQ